MKPFLPLLALALFCSSAPAQDAPARTGSLVRLNDFGSDDVAYFAIPTQAPRGGIVVVHDVRGLVEADKDRVDRLAQEGYIAVAPDLFNGQTADNPVRAEDLRNELDPASAQRTIDAAVAFIRQSPRFRAPRVAIAGWGMGAPLAVEEAIAAATRHEGLTAVACIGGSLPDDAKDVAQLRAPLLYVTDTALSTPAARDRFSASLKDQHKAAQLYLLPANATLAEQEILTWQKLLGFFARAMSDKPQKEGIFRTTWEKLFPQKTATP